MRVSYFFCLLISFVSAQPIFPDGVAPTVSSLRQRQADIKLPDKDDTAKLAKLEERASAGLQVDLASEMDRSELVRFAYELVHVRILKLKFLGGCPRDFDGCPADWLSSQEGCVPTPRYLGMCGATDLHGTSLILKEDFAWRCKADFPCAASCARDFRGCPQNWKNVGAGLCLASSSYDGICSPATDFSSFSLARKAMWASRCGATWCALCNLCWFSRGV